MILEGDVVGPHFDNKLKVGAGGLAPAVDFGTATFVDNFGGPDLSIMQKGTSDWLFGTNVPGDDYPQWLFPFESGNGIYFGPGNVDPVNKGNLYWNGSDGGDGNGVILENLRGDLVGNGVMVFLTNAGTILLTTKDATQPVIISNGNLTSPGAAADSEQFGLGATAYTRSTAIGSGATANNTHAIAIGYGVTTASDHEVRIGDVDSLYAFGGVTATTRPNGAGMTTLGQVITGLQSLGLFS